jgi:hypothetical protein
MEETEVLDTTYRVPYIYRKDTNWATVLTNIAQSYGYVWWIRPDKVLSFCPRAKANESLRDDLGDLILADSTWEGGYWENKYDSLTYKYGASEDITIGTGTNINIQLPYAQSVDLANALANNYYAFYGLRKFGKVDLALYYTQLLNGVQIEIEWMVWKLNIQVGLSSMSTQLELLEDDVSSISTNPVVDCLFNTLYIEGGVWTFYPDQTYGVCAVCPSCEDEMEALTDIWIEILEEGSYTYAERWAGFDDVMSQFPRWESEMRALLLCTGESC